MSSWRVFATGFGLVGLLALAALLAIVLWAEVQAQADSDGDSQGLAGSYGPFFRDDVELFIGTDPLDDCADTSQAFDETGVDNCPFVANPSQADDDDDGLGAACDPDDGTYNTDQDGDGVDNLPDNCPQVSNPGQADADGDDLGDDCDPSAYADIDCGLGGGYPDDADDDNDTVNDDVDNCTCVANGPGEDNQADADGDQTGDACDPAEGVSNVRDIDFDRYGNQDPLSPWPPDFNDNSHMDVGDLVLLRAHYQPLGEPYGLRYDLNADGVITVGDLVILSKYFPDAECTVG